MQQNYTPGFLKSFWSKIDKSGGLNSCWMWMGAKTILGYGRKWDGKRYLYAHRISYELFYGFCPNKLVICHNCDIPSCVNPRHLTLGTQRDNIKDMIQKSRQAKEFRRWNCKLSNSQIEEIRARYADGNLKQWELGLEYGVRQDHISRIVNYKKRIC